MKILTIAFLLVVGLCGAQLTIAGEVNVKKLSKTKWTKLETANFVVVTDASEKKAKEMVEELERFRHFLAILLGYTQKESTKKVPIVLAKKKSSFTALGLSDNYAGLFAKNSKGDLLIFANAQGFKSSSTGRVNWGRSVVLHELVHHIMDNSADDFATPPWFNEGVAEYFGTYVEQRGKIILGNVSILRYGFQSLKRHPGAAPDSVDTESLFKTTRNELVFGDDRTRQEEKFTTAFYARSLAVVHYLNADPDRRKKLYMFLKLLQKGYPIEDTFQYVFEMSFADLDKEVDAYIAGKHMYARVFPMGPDGVEFPEVSYTASAMDQRQALEFLIPKILRLSTTLLGSDDRQTLLADMEALYPGFFHDLPR